jgi:hypothetical protein
MKARNRALEPSTWLVISSASDVPTDNKTQHPSGLSLEHARYISHYHIELQAIRRLTSSREHSCPWDWSRFVDGGNVLIVGHDVLGCGSMIIDSNGLARHECCACCVQRRRHVGSDRSSAMSRLSDQQIVAQSRMWIPSILQVSACFGSRST